MSATLYLYYDNQQVSMKKASEALFFILVLMRFLTFITLTAAMYMLKNIVMNDFMNQP